MEGSCLQLALEGERLCKSGDCINGVQFFEAAVQSGTEDMKVLSAIYSQLGNAYFYLQQYEKAFEFHKHDLNMTRTMNDQQGEAKASGNLGNTLKVLGRYDEAIVCCERHLDLARTMNDKVSIARALYNLGNVYHTKAKHMGNLGQHDPGDFPESVRDALLKSVDFYLDNLDIVRELGDRAAEGRAAGNLGNTFYLLGNFAEAINHHQQRLAIGKEFGDKAAERRAYSNLGNAHIFLGEFEIAVEYYKKALQLAKLLGDLALEAQACYSLGNTFTLLREYPQAIDHHMRHLQIAQELQDKLGQGRAYWSLSNAHTALGNHQKAVQYAQKHLDISREIGDEAGKAAASTNLRDLQTVLGHSHQTELSHSSNKRESMDRMDLLSFSPDGRRTSGSASPRSSGGASSGSGKLSIYKDGSSSASNGRGLLYTPTKTPSKSPGHNISAVMSPNSSNDEDSFLDMLSKFQGRRLDDQRTSLRIVGSNGASHQKIEHTKKEQLMDIVAGVQGSRINDQRANFPGLRGNRNQPHIGQMLTNHANTDIPDDNFFDQLMRCQSTRLEEQRTTLPRDSQPITAPTVPDEDFFSMITRLQSNRLDEQRYELKNPVSMSKNSNTKSPGKDEKKKKK